RDRARILITFKAGLKVVAAVPSRLERIDSNDLISGQTCRECHFGISPLELALALRQTRGKPEFPPSRGKKICDNRHVDRVRWTLEGVWRAGIDGRLREHVVIHGKLLATRSLAVAQLPPFGDRVPVRTRCCGIVLPSLLVFLQRTTLVRRHCGGIRRGGCYNGPNDLRDGRAIGRPSGRTS